MSSDNKTILLTRNKTNRRLYSYDDSRHTNATELLPKLRAGANLLAREGKDGPDVSQEAYFSILAWYQYHGHPLITEAELKQILSRDPLTGEPPK